MNKKEQLYLKAKDAYYKGEDIMTDAEFDTLEAELKKEGSTVINLVGAVDRNAKFPHPSPMLSLSKYLSDKITGEPPVIEATGWLNMYSHLSDVYEASCKYDGNAVNHIYEKVKNVLTYKRSLSRGNGKEGRDYSNKLSRHMPKTLPGIDADVVEIRSEVVLPTDVFAKKYFNGKNNARNFVAGVLNRLDKDVKSEDLDELVVMCHEVKVDRGMSYIPIQEAEVLFGLNPKYKIFVQYFKPNHFEKVFRIFEKYRETSPFLMDGIVLKVDEKFREQLGENKHDPEWGKAIKFKPVGASTEVIDIEWNMGKTGAYAPVFIFKPTVLDGTVVKRASGYNYSHILKNKVFPGAKVRIAKAGDIIPQVIEVLNEGDINKFNAPKTCKHCGEPLTVEGKYLSCTNEWCDGLALFKFKDAMNILDLTNIGSSFIESLFGAGFKSAFNIFDPTITKDTLLLNGFTDGKILDNFIKQRNNVKAISLQNVIRMIGWKGMGRTASLQVAKKWAGQEYSFDGLEKKVVDGFDNGIKHQKLKMTILMLNNFGIKVTPPEDNSNKIKVEFTGSPKPLFKSKAEFLEAIKVKGIVHSKIKDADFLITDKPDGTSSKMKKAKQMQEKGHKIKVLTYEEFYSKFIK